MLLHLSKTYQIVTGCLINRISLGKTYWKGAINYFTQAPKTLSSALGLKFLENVVDSSFITRNAK